MLPLDLHSDPAAVPTVIVHVILLKREQPSKRTHPSFCVTSAFQSNTPSPVVWCCAWMGPGPRTQCTSPSTHHEPPTTTRPISLDLSMVSEQQQSNGIACSLLQQRQVSVSCPGCVQHQPRSSRARVNLQNSSAKVGMS
jgi:hypothetical protein